jgi:hypothetical protein
LRSLAVGSPPVSASPIALGAGLTTRAWSAVFPQFFTGGEFFLNRCGISILFTLTVHLFFSLRFGFSDYLNERAIDDFGGLFIVGD